MQITKIIAVIAVAFVSGCKPSTPASKSDKDKVEVATNVQPETVNSKSFTWIDAFYFFRDIPFDELKKSEFETTNEFSSRVQKILYHKAPIWILAGTNAVNLKYDADNKLCTANIRRPLFTTDDTLSGRKQPESNQRFTVWNYEALNGEISGKRVVTDFNIIITNLIPVELTNSDGIKLTAPMDGLRAKALFNSGNLHVLLKVSVGDLTEINQYTHAYTSGYPYLYVLTTDVPVSLLGIKLMDISNDEVFSSWGDSTQ